MRDFECLSRDVSERERMGDTAIAIATCVGSSSLVSSCPADATIKNVLIIVVSTFNDNNNRQTQRERETERGGQSTLGTNT